jgi:hypothetical protein
MELPPSPSRSALAEICRKSGTSHIARKLGVSEGTLRAHIGGTSTPRRKLRERMAVALGISVEGWEPAGAPHDLHGIPLSPPQALPIDLAPFCVGGARAKELGGGGFSLGHYCLFQVLGMSHDEIVSRCREIIAMHEATAPAQAGAR